MPGSPPSRSGSPTTAGAACLGCAAASSPPPAGISVEYLTQLERGNVGGASDSVLDSLARALQLDEAERTHLLDLARAVGGPRRATARRGAARVRASVQRILDTTGSPAYARTSRGDIVAVNAVCAALYGDVLRPEALPVNVARFVFLDPRSREFFLDWATIADDTAAALRIEAGRAPHDKQLSDLVGEIATRSDEFSTRWGKHDVRLHRTSTKRLHNAVVGDLELTGDSLQLADDDLTLIVYTAPVGSEAQEKLDFLARWVGQASHDPGHDRAVRSPSRPKGLVDP